jgi:hypothetical protein
MPNAAAQLATTVTVAAYKPAAAGNAALENSGENPET